MVRDPNNIVKSLDVFMIFTAGVAAQFMVRFFFLAGDTIDLAMLIVMAFVLGSLIIIRLDIVNEMRKRLQ